MKPSFVMNPNGLTYTAGDPADSRQVDASSAGPGLGAYASEGLRCPNWFAVHAKPRRECFAETNVRALGHEVFLPKLKLERSSKRSRRVASAPLFRGYFFARFTPEDSLESVKCARGVLQVVSSGRFPIPVDETVIREIKDRVEADGYISIRRPALMPGDVVCIEEGPLQGIMGRVERERDDRHRVAILLDTLWNARVLIEERYIQAAAA